MNITHVVSTFSPEHGGPTQEIGNHCEAQSSNGHQITLFTLQGFPGKSNPRRLTAGITQKSFLVWPPISLGFSMALGRELRKEKSPDVYHIHGVWHLAQIMGCREARRRNRPYVYHMMGGFTAYELGRKNVKKKLARWLYQDAAIRSAPCLHVNGESEAQFIREQGFGNPMVVLPVGVDLAAKATISATEAGRIASAIKGRRILLYLARVHATKGVEILVKAWQELARSFPDWVLVVAGTGEIEYATQIQNLAQAAGISDAIFFTGLVTEAEKTWCYQNATVYVLPSFQENFGNTVPEALSNGVPVITTTRTPWAELVTEKCGWICEPTVKNLTAALEEGLAKTPDELHRAGARGKDLVVKKYSLASVIARLDLVYHWLGGGDRPDFLWPN